MQSTPASRKEDRTLLKQAAPANVVNKQGRKIAIFVDTLNATGVVRNAVAIANRMASDGWRVSLIAARAEGPMKASVQPGITIHQVVEGGSPRPTRRRRLIGAIQGYRRFLRSFEPEILLSAGNHGHLPTLLAAGAAPDCNTVFRISNDIEHRQGRTRQGREGDHGTAPAVLLFLRVEDPTSHHGHDNEEADQAQ